MKILTYNQFEKELTPILLDQLSRQWKEKVQIKYAISEWNPAKNPTMIINFCDKQKTLCLRMGTVYGIYINKCQGNIESCVSYLTEHIKNKTDDYSLSLRYLSKTSLQNIIINENDFEEINQMEKEEEYEAFAV